MCGMWRALGTLSLILIVAATAQQVPLYYYPNWLYAMPWRPLATAVHPATPTAAQHLDTQHLSLGYTAPQSFPPAPPPPAPTIRRPVLLGLLAPRPSQEHFTLPFRPSPFAGYSLDEQDEQQQQQQQQQQQLPAHQQQQQQQQQQHQEPPFFAPGYAQPSRRGKPIEEPSGEQRIGEDQQQQQQYLYMSPSNLYNLVRS